MNIFLHHYATAKSGIDSIVPHASARLILVRVRTRQVLVLSAQRLNSLVRLVDLRLELVDLGGAGATVRVGAIELGLDVSDLRQHTSGVTSHHSFTKILNVHVIRPQTQAVLVSSVLAGHHHGAS